MVQYVAHIPAVAPLAPHFLFDTLNKSVLHNTTLLWDYNCKLFPLLAAHQHAALTHGRKLLSLDDVRSISNNYELFAFLAVVHVHRMEYKLK